jgi:small-conductance mechanosensitive channel
MSIPYPISTIGTVAAVVLAVIIKLAGDAIIRHREYDPEEHYRKRQFLTTVVGLAAVVVIAILWARHLQNKGTFLGLIGAGFAIALREPLLSIAGRVAIFAGHMYRVGDRIEINKMSGDVIDVGFFYTRMMEIGNWITADQPSGRIVQLSNASIFGTPVFNYTQGLPFIWDEVKLPVPYDSDWQKARHVMLKLGIEHSKETIEEAEKQLDALKRSYLIPAIALKPATFVKATDNWIELTLRYIVDPRKRRAVSSAIHEQLLAAVEGDKRLKVASATMEITAHVDAPEGGESVFNLPKAS